MKYNKRRYSRADRLRITKKAVKIMEGGKSVIQAASDLKMNRSTLQKWVSVYNLGGEEALNDSKRVEDLVADGFLHSDLWKIALFA